MKRLVLAAACLSVTSAFAHDIPDGLPKEKADQHRGLSEDLALEKLHLQIENEKLEIEKLRKQAADQRKLAAEAELAAAQALSAADLATQKSYRIKIEYARIELISDRTRKCEATAYARWACHGGDPAAKPPKPGDKCMFVVDENVCPIPAGKAQPMELILQYSCGVDQVDIEVPFGANALLSCR